MMPMDAVPVDFHSLHVRQRGCTLYVQEGMGAVGPPRGGDAATSHQHRAAVTRISRRGGLGQPDRPETSLSPEAEGSRASGR